MDNATDDTERDTLPFMPNAVSLLHGETFLELILPFLDTPSRMRLSVLNNHFYDYLWTMMYHQMNHKYRLLPIEGQGPTLSKTEMDLVHMYLPPKIALVHTSYASSKMDYYELPIHPSEKAKIYCDPRTLDDFASLTLFEKTRAVKEYWCKVESASTMYASLFWRPSCRGYNAANRANRDAASIIAAVVNRDHLRPTEVSVVNNGVVTQIRADIVTANNVVDEALLANFVAAVNAALPPAPPAQGNARANAVATVDRDPLENAAKQLCSHFQRLSNVLEQEDIAMDKLCFYERIVKCRMHPMNATKARDVLENAKFLGISPDSPSLRSLQGRYSQYLVKEGANGI